MKRDDLTGLALGGNKTRKLEWIMADLIAGGYDTILTWGGWQSNWCRQVAAAAAQLGIEAHLALITQGAHLGNCTANALLDTLLGAHIHVVPADKNGKFFHLEELKAVLEPIVSCLANEGKKVYLVGVGGSMVEGSMKKPLGALAYLHAFMEMHEQLKTMGLDIKHIVVTSGSSSTQAGLLAGAILLNPGIRVTGISVTLPSAPMAGYVKRLTQLLLDDLAYEGRFDDDLVIVDDRFLGKGYGVIDDDTLEVIRLTAKNEGILLDPVYTGKGMRGLIALLKEAPSSQGATLFWHTGGAPALFAYGDELTFADFS